MMEWWQYKRMWVYMMQKKYEWKRFFCERGNRDPVLVEDAYLYDPEEREGYLNTNVVSFEDVDSVPCVVILGEPGMGKSTALEDEEQRILREAKPDTIPPISIRMEEFSDGGELRRKIFESVEWQDWQKGDKILTLLVDSLDEVTIRIETACYVLTEGFRNADKSRLRVRICCRAGQWPNYFEVELKKLWGKEEEVGIYRILPLRPCDVEKAVKETNGLDSDVFMSEVRNKDLQPFAAKPITLMSLIDEFGLTQTLPGSQWEMYEKLCLKLCDEPNPRYRGTPTLKRSYKLDKAGRIEVGTKIAAVMMLCGRKLVSLEEENKVSEENMLLLDEVSRGAIKHGYIAKDELEETVAKTSLFNYSGNQSFKLGHQTYMEFLAARYFCKLSFRVIKHIFLTCGVGNEKVFPQLREVAAWCSNRNSKLKKWMIKKDPIAMICSDLSGLTEQEKHNLVENLLSELDRLEFFDPNLLWTHVRKVKHPKLGEQLKNYIEDVGKSIHVREAAIDIVRQCRVLELGDLLVDIVTNSNEVGRIRSHACYALENVVTAIQKTILKGVLLDGEGGIDDELKGSLLRILWPDILSVDELLSVLTPAKDQHTIGSYGMFIHEVAEKMRIDDIPKALQHFSNFEVQENIPGYSFERMLDRFFLRGLANIEVANIKTLIAKYMLLRREAYYKFVSHDAEKDFRKIIKSNVNTRRELVSELLKVGVPEGDKRWILVWCVSQCIDFEDFFWLLDVVDNHPVKIKIILMNQAYSYLVQYEGLCITSEHVTRFLEKLEQCEKEVQEDFQILNGISLDSKEAKQWRKCALEQKKHKQDEDERRRAQPKPEDIIERNLTKAKDGELSAWINLCIAICSEGDQITNDFIQKHFLSESQRWRNLNNTIKSGVSEAAYIFLVNNPPKDHSWLSKNSKSRYIWSGQMALGLIGSSPKVLNELPEDILMAWIPTVVGFWGTPDEGFKKVIEHSYKNCSESFFEYLNIRIDCSNECDYCPEIIDHLAGIIDRNLERYLFEKLKEKKCRASMFKRLCTLLLKSRPEGFVEFIISKISAPWPNNEAESKISEIAFQIVLCNWSLKYWENIRTCLSEVPEICERALYNLGYGYRHGETDKLSSLEPWQLAELYVWMRNYRYQKKGTVSVREESMENYSYLTLDNYIVNRLVKTATPQAMNALKYIHKHLTDEHKEYFKYHLNQAEEELQIKSSTEWIPEQVLELHWAEKRRKFTVRLLVLFSVLAVINVFIARSIVKNEEFEKWLSKLWANAALFGVIDGIFIGIWYSLLKAEEKEWFKQIKSKFTGWKN